MRITCERLKKLDSIVSRLDWNFSEVNYEWIARRKNKIADSLAKRAARLTGERPSFKIVFETLN
jgi:hypothetical protein